MSANAPANGPSVPPVAKFNSLRDKFDRAAEEFPGLDAVIIWRPELRACDAERTVLDFRHTILEGGGLSDHVAMLHSLTGLIPPPDENLPTGNQTRQAGSGDDHLDAIRTQRRLYWHHSISENGRPDPLAPNGIRCEGWRFVVLGRDPVKEQAPWRRFDSLARDAAQLILNGAGRGDSLISGWLIALADRPEPLDTTSERAVLLSRAVGAVGSGHIHAEWRRWADPDPGRHWSQRPTASTVSRPICEPGWWLVRLNNVFRLSRVAVDEMLRNVSSTNTGECARDELRQVAEQIPQQQAPATSAAGPPAPSPAVTVEGKGGKPRKVPKAEAEILVSNWLLQNAKDDPASVTREACATDTGVSTGGVTNTVIWQAFQRRRKAEAKPGERKIPLTDEMKAAIPADCATPHELAELIEAQQAEKAEEERRHKRRHKPS